MDLRDDGLQRPLEDPPLLLLCAQRTLTPRLTAWLTGAGYEVESLASGDELLNRLAEGLPAAVCLDLAIRGPALELLREARQRHARLPVLVLLPDGADPSAAMVAGAFSTIDRPVDALQFLAAVGNAVEYGGLRRRLRHLERQLDSCISSFFTGRTLEQIEQHAIEEALERTGHNVSAACRQLGIGRTTLYRKLAKYGQSP